MDMLWIGAKTRIHNFWEDFKTEEKGAAEIVAIDRKSTRLNSSHRL